MLAHVVDDARGGRAPVARLALAGDEERVHEGLRVVAPDADEQAADQSPHHHLLVVDARYHLQTRSSLQQVSMQLCSALQ